MAIKTYHESPNSIFKKVQEVTDGDYCLSHLYVENETYRNHFKEAVALGRDVILDNSIFEGRGLSNEEYANLILDLKPAYYIIPDVLEDRMNTIFNYTTFITEYPDLPGVKIGVVQGKNYKDIVSCYEQLKSLGCRYIAISFDYSYYNLMFPNLDPLFAWCQGRCRLIDKMQIDGVIDETIDHHLLGCSVMKEFSYYTDEKEYGFIKSLDTSNPVVAGVHGLRYAKTRGLQTKPSMKLCDLIDVSLTEKQEEDIMYNIDQFKKALAV